GRFLHAPFGDRRCPGTRASGGHAGGNARPNLTNATLAASRLLYRGSPTAPCPKGASVSIDERHSPLRFIAAERLRGRVKRRARGGVWRGGFLFFTFFFVFLRGAVGPRAGKAGNFFGRARGRAPRNLCGTGGNMSANSPRQKQRGIGEGRADWARPRQRNRAP